MIYTAPVIKGQGRGKILGFPTFNLTPPPELQIKPGIYACWVWINQTKYQGAMHFGPIPTFKQSQSSLEIFLLNYHTDSKVSQLRFQPVKYLRSIIHFPDSKSLTQQIQSDVELVQKVLNQ